MDSFRPPQTWQTPLKDASMYGVESHVLPAHAISPSAPHMLQIPFAATSPVLHPESGQSGPPGIPHTWHLPSSGARFVLHGGVVVQSGCPTSPHAAQISVQPPVVDGTVDTTAPVAHRPLFEQGV
jgi:hypothetical protein